MAGKEGGAVERFEAGLGALDEVFRLQAEALCGQVRAAVAAGAPGDAEKVGRAGKALADFSRSLAQARLAVDRAEAFHARGEADAQSESGVDGDDEEPSEPLARSDRSDLVRRLAALRGGAGDGGADGRAGGGGRPGDAAALALCGGEGPAS